MSGILNDPLLCIEIHMHQPKSSMVPFRPLKIIGQRPDKITMYVKIFALRTEHLCQVVAKIPHATVVVYLPSHYLIGKCRPIFGDDQLGNIWVGTVLLNHLVDGWWIHFPTHRSDV